MQSCEEWCVCICRCRTFSRTRQNTWVCLNAITVIDDSPSCHPIVSLSVGVSTWACVSPAHTGAQCRERSWAEHLLADSLVCSNSFPPPRWFWPLTVDVRQTEACHFVSTVLDNLICDSLYRMFSPSVEDTRLLSKWWFSDRLMLVFDWQNTLPTEYIQTDNNGANPVDSFRHFVLYVPYVA